MNKKTISAFITAFISIENRFQQNFGHFIAWGMFSLILLAALVVILRYGFGTGSIALQEAVLYNHAILFMLGMGYTLLQNKHVRVDVFYSKQSPKRQAVIDLLGGIFLALPSVVFILWSSWDYVASSWVIYESSAEVGGLPYVYLLKTVILMMAILLGLQILSLIAESLIKISDLKQDKPVGRDTLEQEGKL